METIELTQEEVSKLPEYSTSVPTGTTIGKRWKRDNNCLGQTGRPAHRTAEIIMTSEGPDWVLGEYAECAPPDPKTVRIIWRKIVIKEEV